MILNQTHIESLVGRFQVYDPKMFLTSVLNELYQVTMVIV